MIESPRHGLDEAIDRVAAKMVAVPDDAGLLSRTMARLPERTATPWFLELPVQASAAAALVLVAFLWARPSREVSIATPPIAEQAVVSEPRPIEVAAAPIPDPRPLSPDSRSLLRQGFGGQALIAEDHERSLAPVAAIAALELIEIAPPAMELDATAALEPLVLPELALVPQGDS